MKKREKNAPVTEETPRSLLQKPPNLSKPLTSLS